MYPLGNWSDPCTVPYYWEETQWLQLHIVFGCIKCFKKYAFLWHMKSESAMNGSKSAVHILAVKGPLNPTCSLKSVHFLVITLSRLNVCYYRELSWTLFMAAFTLMLGLNPNLMDPPPLPLLDSAHTVFFGSKPKNTVWAELLPFTLLQVQIRRRT